MPEKKREAEAFVHALINLKRLRSNKVLISAHSQNSELGKVTLYKRAQQYYNLLLKPTKKTQREHYFLLDEFFDLLNKVGAAVAALLTSLNKAQPL